MKKLFLLLILSFFSAQSFAGSCPDGSEPIKSISEDGTYFVFSCGNNNSVSSQTNVSISTPAIIYPNYYSGWSTFETMWPGGNSGVKKFNSHNFQYINNSEHSRRGSHYQRFELRNGDCFGTDCERNRQRIEFITEPWMPPVGKQCIAFSIMLDESFETIEPANTHLAQIHQYNGPGPSNSGLQGKPPLLMFKAYKGYFQFSWNLIYGSIDDLKVEGFRFKLISLDEMKGEWNDISFCLDMVNENMSLWVNGKRKFNINQPPIGSFLPESIFFKYGIYQSSVSKYSGSTPTQIVYYDEIRRGSSVEEVDFNINPNLKVID